MFSSPQVCSIIHYQKKKIKVGLFNYSYKKKKKKKKGVYHKFVLKTKVMIL